MSIKTFFHKIKMFFVRSRETSIPYVASGKRYGNYGEDEFVSCLRQVMPMCKIKKNIIINTHGSHAEIDCLVLYENKLFAIEVKYWKGRLIETESGFIQEKVDRWTGELHIKNSKSPFKQLNRAIYLLRKQIPDKVWINGIVFFGDTEFEGIETFGNEIWFHNMQQLVQYISNNGEETVAYNANKFFNNCIAADCLYSENWDKSLRCRIYEDSLRFQMQTREIKRSQIRCIKIKHHWSYDELNITLRSGESFFIAQENAKIKVDENGLIKEFALCKLDYIELGI